MAPRAQLAEELLRRLAASLRAGQLYSKGHPIITLNLDSLSRAIDGLHDLSPTLVVGILDDEFIVDEVPVPRAEALAPLVRRLRQIGVERITIEKGVGQDEIACLAEVVSAPVVPTPSPPAPCAICSLPSARGILRRTLSTALARQPSTLGPFGPSPSPAPAPAAGGLPRESAEARPWRGLYAGTCCVKARMHPAGDGDRSVSMRPDSVSRTVVPARPPAPTD